MHKFSFIKHAAVGAFLVLGNAAVFAADPAPRIVREPVFGLHYELARVKFDPLPPQVLSNCETLTDTENLHSVWFVYGQARDASGRIFYVTGGYDVWLDGRPAHQRFETEDLGLVLRVDGSTCEPLDPARDVFDQRNFDDALTPPILGQLATDVVRRLERAFGGPARLKVELHNQHINLDMLPPELGAAMKDYLGR